MMSENLFASKTKADLIEIVRMTGVLPVGKAQKMKKQELVDFLNSQLSDNNLEAADEEKAKSEEATKAEIAEESKSNSTEEIKTEEAKSEQDAEIKSANDKKSSSNTDKSKKETAKKKTNSNNSKDKTNSKSNTKKRSSKSEDNNSKNIDQLNDSNKENLSKTNDSESNEDLKDKESGFAEINDSNFIAKARPRKNSKTSKDKVSNEDDEANKTEDADNADNVDLDNEDSNDNGKKAKDLPLVDGVLEIMPDGYGFLRTENYIQGPRDVYVQAQMIKRFSLRSGDFILGNVKDKHDKDQFGALVYIHEVNGRAPETMHNRANFERLTPVYPQDKFVLETERHELSTRIIDLFSPIGKGQRGMIVSPPKAGKTILLQKIANAISKNNPETKLFVLLIDERPEEVTDMQRRIDGEVVYSTFDKSPENHVKISELVLERAKRLVELGEDVVILVDSLTRMARAYNLTITPTGRTLTGGLDPAALHHPKRFFGAARNIENGGSLTILATALVETGSRMDEVIFEEFKGTGNMEVYLDRKLSEKRIFPAIDVNRSSTRREELLLSNDELEAVWAVRKAFSTLDTSNVTELIISLMLKTKTNKHMIESLNISLKDKNIINAMKLKTDNNSSNGNGNSYSSDNSNGNSAYYDY